MVLKRLPSWYIVWLIFLTPLSFFLILLLKSLMSDFTLKFTLLVNLRKYIVFLKPLPKSDLGFIITFIINQSWRNGRESHHGSCSDHKVFLHKFLMYEMTQTPKSFAQKTNLKLFILTSRPFFRTGFFHLNLKRIFDLLDHTVSSKMSSLYIFPKWYKYIN